MSFRARIANGRLVHDEPTDLSEGYGLELVPADSCYDLGHEERAELHAAIDDAREGLDRGESVSLEDLFASLRPK